LRTYHDQGRTTEKKGPASETIINQTVKRKFAVPTVGQVLTPHFGHCDQFAIIDTEDDHITHVDFVEPPAHQPGVYPAFLAGKGVHVIISGGMGHRARDLFNQHNIEVCVGVLNGSPRELVGQYLNEQLQTGENLCDH
jgi:predicted Fe-Mo cluster-binding NifX family protein